MVFNDLSAKTVQKISRHKKEPDWILDYRLKSLKMFEDFRKKDSIRSPKNVFAACPEKASKTSPKGVSKNLDKSKFFSPGDLTSLLQSINFDDISYYKPADFTKQKSWEEVPSDIKATFDKLGIPEAEKRILAGVEAQVDSEAIYGSIKNKLNAQGVVFTNIEKGLSEYPELFRKYFGLLVKPSDNKFAALNGAFWSGGSFLYVPKGVKVDLPLQAYFRINARSLGQFERTLIIAEEDSSVHYVEGCTAPLYSTDSLHAGVVEVFVGKNASVRYTTVQNWSKNVYNLVTKKSRVEEGGKMVWVDGNLGSKLTMKYPSCYLVGENAHGEMLSVGYASDGQVLSSGARMIHQAPHTTSKVISKSIATGAGVSNYQGEVRIEKGAIGSQAYIQCDSLLLDKDSVSSSYPLLKVQEPCSIVEHEASATKLDEEKVRYLQSRGLDLLEVRDLLIKGFVSPIVSSLPIEYALEFNKLLESSF